MSNTHQPAQIVGIIALVDIPKQRFVALDGDLCGAGEKALGVSELARDAGRPASVITYGLALVEAGGVVAAKAPVTSDANGKAVAATAVSVSVPVEATPVTSDAAQPELTVAGGYLPEAINGYALDAASAEGDLIRILVAV